MKLQLSIRQLTTIENGDLFRAGRREGEEQRRGLEVHVSRVRCRDATETNGLEVCCSRCTRRMKDGELNNQMEQNS